MTGIDLDAIRARARVIDPCLLDDVPLTLAESAAIAYAPHDIDALCDEVAQLDVQVDELCDEVGQLRAALDYLRGDLATVTASRDRYYSIASERGVALAEARADITAVRALHQDRPSQGYYPDDGSSYGWMQHACTSCGTPGEYGIPYPCPTIRALDGEE